MSSRISSIDVRPAIQSLREKVNKKLTGLEGRIENIAAYLANSLMNEPKRVKSAPPKNLTGNSTHYMAASKPNTIFIPDGHGGIQDTGETVADFLKRIKGGYRANGSGSFQKEKIQTRAKGSKPPGTYAYENQRPGEFFTKGTGRFSERENQKLKKIRELNAKLADPLTRGDRKRLHRITLQINRLERQLDSDQLSDRRRKTVAAKSREKWQKQQSLRADLEAKRRKKLDEQRQKRLTYRIVIPSARGGYTDAPKPATLLQKGSAAGQAPKSWPCGGLREYFMSKRDGGTNPETGKKVWRGNWQVRKIGRFHYEVSIRPAPKQPHDLAGSNQFLHTLERGGSVLTTPVVKGYLLNTRDTSSSGRRFSHRRISLMPIKSKSKTVSVAPRPFVRPVVERVREYVRKRNRRPLETIGANFS